MIKAKGTPDLPIHIKIRFVPIIRISTYLLYLFIYAFILFILFYLFVYLIPTRMFKKLKDVFLCLSTASTAVRQISKSLPAEVSDHPERKERKQDKIGLREGGIGLFLYSNTFLLFVLLIGRS